MKFSHQHVIPGNPTDVWNLTADPQFTKESYAKANATHELIRTEQKNGKIVNRIRVTVNAPKLPSFVAKITGSPYLSYEQIETIDAQKRTNDWVILIPKLEKKVKASGRFTIAEHGSQSKRLIEGEVKVLIPLIGGKIEKHISKQLEESQKEISNLLIERLS
ncbi:MAG: DUF2505 domain-containing protein [Myxococcota bacterium]|nr:DUF2505 domain-containing protein [Myxococcota bacterium]